MNCNDITSKRFSKFPRLPGFSSGLLKAAAVFGAAVWIAAAPVPAAAQSDTERLRLLEKTVEELLKRDEEREKVLRELKSKLASRDTGKIKSGDAGHEGHGHGGKGGGHGKSGDVWSGEVGDGTLRFVRLGIDVTAAAGYSSERNAFSREVLQAGGHDPKQTGFTLQSLDLSFSGAYDPYFSAFVALTYFLDQEGESRFELEEANFQTREIAGFLTVKAGQYFTGFGQFNTLHVHDWTFVDQPLIANRMFGPDGIRGQGVEATARLPLPWQSAVLLGMQNPFGETMASFGASDELFEERSIGGYAHKDLELDAFRDFVYLARLRNSVTPWTDGMLRFGVSSLFGPNATGSDGRTVIVGGDVGYRHNLGGGRYIDLASEFMWRHYKAEDRAASGGTPGNTLVDYGFYVQGLAHLHPRFGAGLRYGYVTGMGQGVGDLVNRQIDPFRADRHRLSPMGVWKFSELASLKVQYNWDQMNLIPGDKVAHSVWLQLNWSFGLGGADHAHHEH